MRSRAERTVLGFWMFWAIWGAVGVAWRLLRAPDGFDLAMLGIVGYHVLGWATTYFHVRGWPGRHALMAILSVCTLVPVAFVVGCFIGVFLSGSPLPLLAVLFVVPELLCYALLCRLLLRQWRAWTPERAAGEA